MRLTLRIDNLDYRDDGGPLDYTSEGRDFVVGRHSQVDWSLPDPTKTISRSHFEIRFDEAGAWLHDLSMVGTFVVGESHRVASPRLLRSGERLRVGGFILLVTIESAPMGRPAPLPAQSLAQTSGPGPAAWAPAGGQAGGAATGPAGGWGGADWGGTSPGLGGPRPPPTEPPAPPTAPPQRPAPAAVRAEDWRQGVCAGMGLAPGALDGIDPQLLGRTLAAITEDLMALLGARAIIKRNVRSKQQTVIAPLENNPLKFRANATEALEAMFARPSPGYLGAEAAFRAGFADLRRHETAMVAALQPALARLLEDLSPEAIEQRAEAGLFANRKARAWEVFVERWDAKTHPYENGMLDLFLTYFAEGYDQAADQRTSPPLGRG